jgi:hypothetical protein
MSLYSGKATDHVVFDRLFQAKETCAVSYKNNTGNTGMAKQEEEWRASRKSACEAVQRKSGDDWQRARLAPMCFTRPFSGSASFCGGSWNPGLLERRSISLASPIPWNVRPEISSTSTSSCTAYCKPVIAAELQQYLDMQGTATYHIHLLYIHIQIAVP